MKCSNLANGSVSFSWFHWRKELHYRILLVCVSTAAAAVPSISFNRDSFIFYFFYLIFLCLFWVAVFLVFIFLFVAFLCENFAVWKKWQVRSGQRETAEKTQQRRRRPLRTYRNRHRFPLWKTMEFIRERNDIPHGGNVWKVSHLPLVPHRNIHS